MLKHSEYPYQSYKRSILAIILVGNDPASEIYVNKKRAAANRLGLTSLLLHFPKDTNKEILCKAIVDLNARPNVVGIMVQLPLPNQLYTCDVVSAIQPDKDVDGLHFENLGYLYQGYEMNVKFESCTAAAVLLMLDEIHFEYRGKHVVVVNSSNIVGKPLAAGLLNRGVTVTICNEHTQNLKLITGAADVLVVAIGSPEFFTDEYIKTGAIVIDIGINRTSAGIKGDVHFESVSKKAAWVTPVPNGVGPVTVAMLMKNVARSCMIKDQFVAMSR